MEAQRGAVVDVLCPARETRPSQSTREDSANGEKKLDIADCKAEMVESGEDDDA